MFFNSLVCHLAQQALRLHDLFAADLIVTISTLDKGSELKSTRSKSGLSPTRLDRIVEHLSRSYIDTGKIVGCQVAVARHGELAYFRSLGQMDKERNLAMRDDAIFRIYSMTKPITSVALMMLFERGYFQLDDPVSKFIPEWRKQRVWESGEGENMITVAPKRPVTIRDMLCHTGGITYGAALKALNVPDDRHPVTQEYERLGIGRTGDQTLRSFVLKLADVPLRYHPGERWMYSLSTDVCAALVEIISGKTFDQFLNEEILGLLSMTDTSFQISNDRLSRFSANYRGDFDNTLTLIDDPHSSVYAQKPLFLSGGGGLLSTTTDYVRFCEMLRRGGELDGVRILSRPTIDLMHANHLPQGTDLSQMALGLFSETKNAGIGFGLGFASIIDPIKSGSVSTNDWYWGGAASTIFWVDDKEDLVVVFMTQLIPSSTYDFRGQLKSLVYASIED